MTEAARIQAILAGHTEEYAYFLDRYADAIHRMVAGIVDCAEDAEYVAAKLRGRHGIERVEINFIGPVIGSHSGPGTVALFFLGSQR